MTQSGRRDVHRFLRSKGYRLKAPKFGAAASYEGPLPFRGGSAPIRLDIVDWDFKSRPEVSLLERPEALLGFRPHMGHAAIVCYLDRESVYMDPYDPVGVIGRCLLEATSTLEKIAGHKNRLDLQGEFLANWRAPALVPLMIWTQGDETKRMLSVRNVDFPHKQGVFVVTDSVERTSKCLDAIGAKLGVTFEGAAVEFTTPLTPAIDPDRWPPRTLRDVIEWLGAWDDKLRRSFLGRLESQWTVRKTYLLAMFSTPAGRFGFSFNVSYATAVQQTSLAKRQSDRRQRILNQNPKIDRFVASDLSPAFLHGRNQSERETLADRKIALIGCGTVGGYLATFLSRTGAGLGVGSLTLYDPESLMPENLGRHVLSFADLYRNKAEGVVDFIKKEFPYIKATARKCDATEATDLFDADLLIDASGSSPISSIVNRGHISRLKAGALAPAVLHIWVEGPGDAARALIVDSLKFMCHDCLLRREVGQIPKDRFPVSTRESALTREHPGGCGSYMPFPVSASVTAAALALDAVRDWARGDPHPRLRSMRLDLAHTQAREDSSPKALDSCPACRPR